MSDWVIMLLIALGAGGLAWALLLAWQDRNENRRLQSLAAGGVPAAEEKRGFLSRLADGGKNDRRRKLEESLREMQQAERKRKKRITLRQRLQRAGLQTTVLQFNLFSLVLGLILAALAFLFFFTSLSPLYAIVAAAGAFLIGTLGIPFWLLRFLTNRRMQRFLFHLPDAVELMVRGLRSGLPVTDAMRTIAEEVPEPVGPEFREVVDGQKIGIPFDQGLERMYERVPLPEVRFLGIVLAIQKETGGNLSETLANLSDVLRARKAMKLKVQAISTEAKVSAIIIGSLPIGLFTAIYFINPGYLDPLLFNPKGQMIAVLGVSWMVLGMLIMRKMINFKV